MERRVTVLLPSRSALRWFDISRSVPFEHNIEERNLAARVWAPQRTLTQLPSRVFCLLLYVFSLCDLAIKGIF